MATPRTFYNCKLELSADGAAWMDATGDSNKIDVGGFELETEGTSVFGQNSQHQTVGGMAIGTVTVRAFYQESPPGAMVYGDAAYGGGAYYEALTAWELARAAFNGRTNLYLRWSPRGGALSQSRFMADAGRVKRCLWPSGGRSALPAMIEIQVETPNVTRANIGFFGQVGGFFDPDNENAFGGSLP